MKKFTFILACLFIIGITDARPCTRVVYKGPKELIITTRSMDWKDKIDTNLWIFPRGMERNGEIGANSLTWTSKYGSVVASAYDIASTDGINEKGLAANLLWLAESTYPTRAVDKKGISIAAWVQYLLDNYATVEEAVNELKDEPFLVISDMMPTGERMATLHLSISDALGDNAIFEYIDGKLVIHHDKSYNVMTNSPTFEKQLALNDYWQQIGGTTMLPGTNRAADRFVRASFYKDAVAHTDDPKVAVYAALSVIRNCSVPFGISTANQPNISSTRWRSMADQTNLVYYFEDALEPNLLSIPLKYIDFSPKAGVKKLNLLDGQTYTGNVVSKFKKAKPFQFIGIEEHLQ